MSQALRQLIQELRAGADLSAEGATSVHWRTRIQALPALSVQNHGLGLALMASAARTLLLQRGHVREQSDAALCGVLVELANILETEQRALDERTQSRATARGETPYYLREGA